MFGSGDALKSKAMEVIYEAAGRNMTMIPAREYYGPRDANQAAVAELLGPYPR
jgi:hypothetical protein